MQTISKQFNEKSTKRRNEKNDKTNKIFCAWRWHFWDPLTPHTASPIDRHLRIILRSVLTTLRSWSFGVGSRKHSAMGGYGLVSLFCQFSFFACRCRRSSTMYLICSFVAISPRDTNSQLPKHVMLTFLSPRILSLHHMPKLEYTSQYGHRWQHSVVTGALTIKYWSKNNPQTTRRNSSFTVKNLHWRWHFRVIAPSWRFVIIDFPESLHFRTPK